MEFEIYKDTKGEYRWRFWSNNWKIICWSEGYTDKESAKHSISLVKSFAASAPIKDSTVSRKFLTVIRKGAWKTRRVVSA